MKHNLSEADYRKLKNLVYQILELDTDIPEDEVEQEYLDSWSSSKHLTLIMEIEAAFGVNFQIDNIVQMNTFELIAEALGKLKG